MKKITRDKEGYYIMIKGSIQEEDLTIVTIYEPNIRAPQYIRQILTDIKGEINSNTIIVEDFNTPLTPMDRSSKQKINKETQVLYNKKKKRICLYLDCSRKNVRWLMKICKVLRLS